MLFVKRDEGDVGERGCSPNSVRMNHRRGSRGVGFGSEPRCVSVGDGRSRGRPSLRNAPPDSVALDRGLGEG